MNNLYSSTCSPTLNFSLCDVYKTVLVWLLLSISTMFFIFCNFSLFIFTTLAASNILLRDDPSLLPFILYFYSLFVILLKRAFFLLSRKCWIFFFYLSWFKEWLILTVYQPVSDNFFCLHIKVDSIFYVYIYVYYGFSFWYTEYEYFLNRLFSIYS